ncbi:MAG: hypothetical protein HFJ47_01710 [Clostridia bacterium]|nr:hypothetical protein [Clostridia bacterium]
MQDIENIKNVIKKELEKQINEEYTDYKNKKLQDLDYELERKRNEIVQDILNSITILNEETPFGLNIMIKVENRIIQK